MLRYLWLDICDKIFVISSNASTYLEECPSCWEHHVGEEGTEKIITINTDWKREVIYLKIHKRDQNLWQSFSADEKNVSWWSFQRRQKFSGIAILFFKLFFLLIWLCCLTYISFSVHFCPAPSYFLEPPQVVVNRLRCCCCWVAVSGGGHSCCDHNKLSVVVVAPLCHRGYNSTHTHPRTT